MRSPRLLLLVLALAVAACADAGDPAPGAGPEDAPVADEAPLDDGASDLADEPPDDERPGDEPPAGDAASVTERPDWLGTRVLPERADGLGEVQPTPDELRDRRLPPPEHLPRPEDDAFTASVEPVPAEVAERSTWTAECPVGLDDLRYVTVTFWGFDERAHTGELLVHASVADDLVGVFETLYEARFPIEEMRVVAPEELDAPPTGDGNNTTAFVCRSKVESDGWSEHASGLAVDVNPFHNPYVRGDVVVPELASAYVDRDDDRPGMIHSGDVVTEAFAGIGWGWGGDWRSAKDWMHFSASGR